MGDLTVTVAFFLILVAIAIGVVILWTEVLKVHKLVNSQRQILLDKIDYLEEMVRTTKEELGRRNE